MQIKRWHVVVIVILGIAILAAPFVIDAVEDYIRHRDYIARLRGPYVSQEYGTEEEARARGPMHHVRYQWDRYRHVETMTEPLPGKEEKEVLAEQTVALGYALGDYLRATPSAEWGFDRFPEAILALDEGMASYGVEPEAVNVSRDILRWIVLRYGMNWIGFNWAHRRSLYSEDSNWLKRAAFHARRWDFSEEELLRHGFNYNDTQKTLIEIERQKQQELEQMKKNQN